MGLSERIPLDREPLKATDPRDRAIIDYASQPPIGCRYVDTSTTCINVANNTTVTLDFIAATGIQYDPYNMIDITADSITIPQPGVWDIGFEVFTPAAAVADGDVLWAGFTQGLIGINGTLELLDQRVAARAAIELRLSVSQSIYISQATLGNGSLYYIRALAQAHGNDAKIITFSAWLRSAVIPSRY